VGEKYCTITLKVYGSTNPLLKLMGLIETPPQVNGLLVHLTPLESIFLQIIYIFSNLVIDLLLILLLS
jgi:hypothetical protein